MARAHGRVLSSIWEDDDFLALTQQQQRLYLFLISQPNLNHAGLLPLTLRRWARKAAGLTATELEKELQALADAHFIVLDDDTEELLIRSFVRNDGVWRMPKVMGAMVSGAMEIESKALRRALLAEMDRIPLDDLSDAPTKSTRGEGPSVRAQVAEHIATLRKALGTPDDTPPGGGSATPSSPPSGTPSETPAEGGRKPSTRARAGAHVRAAPSPSPAPTPAPSLSPAAATAPTAVADTQNERETNNPTDPQPATFAQQTIRAAHVVTPDEEADFLTWVTDTHKPRGTGWWKTVTANGDLPTLAADWRATRTPRITPVAALPTWCGHCGDGIPLARTNADLRQIEDGRGIRRPCPACHPTAIRKAS